ncbi:ABC transporter ATP-binding protein [Staphylococcus agnetis]|uniref:ABC transporter ATP-binding protein n=1 Tax=Staphylococcus agnetis TaxID=985762 RepID=A0ABD7TUZ9_9STAP|nr:ATP-binding cassette domain-containing protein [Staphylococcus agnetis]UXU58068.1 ABC transporter ATP-binding protein [Staphylococcus agnetis]
MGSAIVLKIINVTHFYRNQKKQNILKPFSYQPEDIELNNITLHIYQGESLGIIGEADSSKSLVGEILAGTVKPDKGRMARTATLFYANMNQKTVETMSVRDYVQDVIQLYEYEVTAHKVEQIIKYAHLASKENDAIQNLADEEYAQLLFSMARASKAEIIILSHILTYLDEDFMTKASSMAREYIDEGLTWVTIDNDITKIQAVSNYIAWISHGQLRQEGPVKQVVGAFLTHEKDRSSIKSEEALAYFDDDWKRNRSRMPELTYNFKRIERYHHSEPPAFLARVWIWLAIFFMGIVLGSLFIFTNFGQLESQKVTTEDTIAKNNEDPFIEKLAYGIVDAKNVQLTGKSGQKDLKLPRYAIATITGENKTSYRIENNGEVYTASKSQFKYMNPAALYRHVERDDIAPYMKSNYINYVDYFNGELHKSHKTVNDTLVPDSKNRYVESITQQPISMLFDDRNKLIGYTFPMVDTHAFKKKFKPDEKYWIVKSEEGYFIADVQNDQWIYIKL